ncbi:GNAT family N-acetyltransferase [Actinomadura madurae]|uniref:GNAT family N-acetyltransferase n=1 Tax=Actinomadura madurae TaxID=1993 RepID=UPI002026DF60|nr:GNAT family N-acetyltransferase [Actinomadura madurae]URM94802.1 GNAT family N-acetyltransferase [Actinomadura madurae]URN05527.1 GNAT family N-acetyltransferase [Actinomadura madurae]
MIEIRDIPEADAVRMRDFAGVVFHLSMDDGDQERDGWPLLRAERIGAYDGGTLVGQLGALPMRLAVPGALLDCSAVTFVGVLPTHRRRGILTSMMDRMDADAIATGRPVAALWASEGVIYGRYGFGLATRAIGLEVDSSRPLDLRTVPDDRPLRLVDTASAPDLLGPIHDRSLAVRPGGLVRDADWWTRGVLRATDRDAEGYTAPRIVHHPAGYAVYRARGGTIRVVDLVADTPQAEAALWRFLASIDLSSRVVAPNRPVDDLLPHMAADSDQVTVTHGFGALWLRLIDVPAALRARSWATDDTFVLEVGDPRIPGNDGRWRLGTSTTGAAACEATTERPDLTLTAADLAAVYLGGQDPVTLTRVGAVTEHTPGAAARLAASLAVPLAPYINDDF